MIPQTPKQRNRTLSNARLSQWQAFKSRPEKKWGSRLSIIATGFQTLEIPTSGLVKENESSCHQARGISLVTHYHWRIFTFPINHSWRQLLEQRPWRSASWFLLNEQWRFVIRYGTSDTLLYVFLGINEEFYSFT